MTRRDLDEDVHAPQDLAKEQHYTEAEIAANWHVHRKRVHRMFDSVPGVLEFGEDSHRSHRIPDSVMLGVHRDLRRRS